MKVSKKNGRQKSPSKIRNWTADQSMRRQCRRAERKWRKTKLEIHYSINEDSLHAFNVELATARQTFFSNLINYNSLNNTHTLFAIVERLTNPPQVRFPVKCSQTANAMSFITSFLRSSITSERRLAYPQVIQRSHKIRPQFPKEVTMSVFEAIGRTFWKKYTAP